MLSDCLDGDKVNDYSCPLKPHLDDLVDYHYHTYYDEFRDRKLSSTAYFPGSSLEPGNLDVE